MGTASHRGSPPVRGNGHGKPPPGHLQSVGMGTASRGCLQAVGHAFKPVQVGWLSPSRGGSLLQAVGGFKLWVTPPNQPRRISPTTSNPDRQATTSNPDRQAQTESTQIGKPKPNQPRSPSPSRINRFRAKTENPKDHAGKPKPPPNNHHHAGNRKPQKLFVLHNVQTPKKFQRREKFSCFKNPQKFSDRNPSLF